MTDKKHKLFTYGSLRNGEPATHMLMGYALFDYGRFPYIAPSKVRGDTVYGNLVEVDDKMLGQLDKYENIRSGLFERVEVGIYSIDDNDDEEATKVFVYVAGNIIPPRVESGDWLKR